jgi:fructokinase
VPTRFAVIGEALVDLVATEGGSYLAKPGGSPYNVALGLARLGQQVELFARAGRDGFGELLYTHVADSGVDLTGWTRAEQPTSLAVATLDAAGQASYDFYLDSTAALRYDAADLPAPGHIADVLHVGSLASWMAPSRELIGHAQRSAFRGGSTLVSYDPNVRPALLSSRDRAAELVETSIAMAHIVKASDADTQWLYPDRAPAEVAQRWLELGVTVVIITLGQFGATVFTRARPAFTRSAPSVTVVDTVGAGDAFTAGLLASLACSGVQELARLDLAVLNHPELLRSAVDRALEVASLTCERAGANPPTGAELARRFSPGLAIGVRR